MTDLATSQSTLPTWVGRQPILDPNLDVRGYEILYRDGLDDRADFSDSELATARSFWNTFIELGVDSVSPDQRTYINVTPAFLVGNCVEIFPPARIVLEIAARESIDAAGLARIAELRGRGYQAVLDGWDGRSVDLPVLTQVSGVKLDVNAFSAEELEAATKSALDRGLTVMSKKIEDYSSFERSRKLGHHSFQGHFLSRPQIVAGGRAAGDSVSRMRLIAAVNDVGGTVEKLVDVISQDLSLSFKLLRYVNSSLFSLPSEIESIRHAVDLLGPRWIRTWANLMILANISDRPQAVLDNAVIRARMCETLARRAECPKPENYFTTGLFSSLDALFNRPLGELLQELPLSRDLGDALLRHEGEMGEALACTLAYEHSAWDTVGFKGLEGGAIRDAYIESLRWAAELRRTGAA